MKRALITGVTGQDGSYLTELLLQKGYEVHGIVRPGKHLEETWLATLAADPSILRQTLFFHPSDLRDRETLRRIIPEVKPDEIYHLGGQSNVGESFRNPEKTIEVAALSTTTLLEATRALSSNTRFFHASSALIFGNPRSTPQNEQTPIDPSSPYACAKAFSTQLVRVYRETHGLFAWNGILYNHESPRRSPGFVTRKICQAVARIKLGRQQTLELGDLDAERDWGDARDYVHGTWLGMQHPQPEDFVFATGKTHRVRDILDIAFKTVELDWAQSVRTSARFDRPTEKATFVGDASKAAHLLGWRPQMSFEQLIREMTQIELERAQTIHR